jgi:hypothetical protein
MKFAPHQRSVFDHQPEQGLAMLTGELDRAGSRVKRMLMVVVLVGGAIALVAVTFVGVAAWQIMTSKEVSMIAGAARDKAHASALEVASSAKCDRLIAEARASGQFLPACASQGQGPASSPRTDAAIDAMVRAAID